MKKIIAILLSLALIFTFVGCGTETPDSGDGTDTEEETQQEGEDAQESEDSQDAEEEGENNGLTGPVYELSLSAPDSVPVQEGTVKFFDLCEEYSMGTLIVKNSTDETLTDDSTRIQKVMDGELDIAIGLSSNFASVIKDLHMFDVYYLFEDKDEVNNVGLSSDIVDALEASFEKKGLKCLSLWGNDFRELTTNRKAVKNPKRLKGLKIATSDTKIDKAAWKAMGARAVAMEPEDRTDAIKNKKIAGQESTLEFVVNAGLQDIEKYCIMTDHLYTPYVVVMNLEKYNALGDMQKKALLDSISYARNLELERCDAFSKYAFGVIDKSDMEVITLTDKQKAAFRKKVKSALTRKKAKKLMDDPKILKYLDDKLDVYRVEASAETEDEAMDWEG